MRLHRRLRIGRPGMLARIGARRRSDREESDMEKTPVTPATPTRTDTIPPVKIDFEPTSSVREPWHEESIGHVFFQFRFGQKFDVNHPPTPLFRGENRQKPSFS